jgi:hypothetical protein
MLCEDGPRCPACITIRGLSAVSRSETVTEMIGELGLPLVTAGYGVWALECLRLLNREAS